MDNFCSPLIDVTGIAAQLREWKLLWGLAKKIHFLKRKSLEISMPITRDNGYLVGGFNPSEKYESNCIISPNRGENKKYLKPPPRYSVNHGMKWHQHISDYIISE